MTEKYISSIDRQTILGIVYGCALGDSLSIESNNCIVGDWSYNFDQFYIIVEYLFRKYTDQIENENTELEEVFKTWISDGIPELNKINSRIEDQLQMHLENGTCFSDENDISFICRSIASIFTTEHDLWIERLTKVSHDHVKYINLIAYISDLIKIISIRHDSFGKDTITTLFKILFNNVVKGESHQRWKEISNLMLEDDIKNIRKYDSSDKICKAYAYATWICRTIHKHNLHNIKDILKEVAMDNDRTYTAIVGGIIGACVGIDGLPNDWIAEMQHDKMLRNKINGYITTITIETSDED